MKGSMDRVHGGGPWTWGPCFVYALLHPAFWTQGSGTKYTQNTLKLLLKINSRVTLSDRKRKTVPESGNCNSKCVVSKGLAPGQEVQEPKEDPEE